MRCLRRTARTPPSAHTESGAPLEKPVQQKTPTPAPSPQKPIHPALQKESPEKIVQKITEKAEDAYYVYAIGWRTLAEALAIAVSAFIIGAASGITGLSYWGLLGGIAVGVTVGLTWKNFYFAVISAPLGAIFGLALGILLPFFGLPWGIPILITIFSAWGAKLGGSPRPNFKYRNWWEKARPFLGGFGGFIFSLLGLMLGLGIEKMISNLFA